MNLIHCLNPNSDRNLSLCKIEASGKTSMVTLGTFEDMMERDEKALCLKCKVGAVEFYRDVTPNNPDQEDTFDPERV